MKVTSFIVNGIANTYEVIGMVGLAWCRSRCGCGGGGGLELGNGEKEVGGRGLEDAMAIKGKVEWFRERRRWRGRRGSWLACVTTAAATKEGEEEVDKEAEKKGDDKEESE